jgi:hypothetical protein
MGFDRKQFKEASKSMYAFDERRIEPIGSISMPVSFGGLHNARTEYITFDVAGMHYPYNAIFDRGLLNTFEATLHSAYLCLNLPDALGVISIHDSQKDARNIEQGFAPGHRNVNCLQYEKIESCNDTSATKSREGLVRKIAIEPKCKTKRVPLDPKVPDRTVIISKDLSPRKETELLSFLDKNNDVFVWQTSDLMGVSRIIIKHRLQVNPSAKPKKQKLLKMSNEKVTAAKLEVQRLPDA